MSASDRGDNAVDPIYHAVGFALSQWETAEVMLVDLFLTMCECENSNSYNPVRRAFGSFESSGGRRKALEEAAEVYFGQYWTDPAPANYQGRQIGGQLSNRDHVIRLTGAPCAEIQ